MKMSDWLRQWQITGEVPDGESPEFAFWAGWILGAGRLQTSEDFEDKRTMAIKAAEFIENQV